MVVWQMTHCGGMRVRHRKLAKACGGNFSDEFVDIDFDLVEARLDGDFPAAGPTVEGLLGIQDQLPRGLAQLRVIRHRPEENMGIEQDAHYRPSNAASKSSGSG